MKYICKYQLKHTDVVHPYKSCGWTTSVRIIQMNYICMLYFVLTDLLHPYTICGCTSSVCEKKPNLLEHQLPRKARKMCTSDEIKPITATCLKKVVVVRHEAITHCKSQFHNQLPLPHLLYLFAFYGFSIFKYIYIYTTLLRQGPFACFTRLWIYLLLVPFMLQWIYIEWVTVASW